MEKKVGQHSLFSFHCIVFKLVDNENSLKSRRASNAYTKQSVLLSVCLFHL